MRKQRLIVLFDGTWNDPEDQTNVYRLSRCIQNYDGNVRQKFFYDPGVGTTKWSRFRGALGYGLSKNLLQGYEWLAKHYTDGHEIWLFGFSRGSYTARSLVGLINKCGLLHIVTPKLLEEAEKIYRDKSLSPDSEPCTNFRERYSRKVKVHFIGVWDTVGALGVPGTFLSERGKYAWHDTRLSSIVERAYHAVALDEFREVYNVALWTGANGKPKPEHLEVEQRWFIGAHANVGGGYGSDPLADIAFQWMLGNAAKAGLKLNEFEVSPYAWKSAPKNSFKEFLGGMYAFFRKLKEKGDGRFYRNYSQGLNGLPAINISVDESVWMRWKAPDYAYRPQTLTDAGQQPQD